MVGRYSGDPRNEELAYLADLIADFGVPDAPSPKVAAQSLYTRYVGLNEFVPVLGQDRHELVEAIVDLIQELHGVLCRGILRNAVEC
ncbi:MAG: hypothetical protein RhofKO_39530 [Rhodothermales bacterium]